MKKILALLLLTVTNAFAFDSSTAFNVVTMSYTANTGIYQRIVLSDTQKAQTSVNFTVDVKNGGGRPTHDLNGVPQAYSSQTDSAYITVKVFDTNGVLIGSQVSSTYILKNWGSNAGWSAVPGDNLQPWTTASVTYNGALANARFIEVWMTGTDGAWWAGNYGPEWRTPTVTVGSSTQNIAYNPEFGVSPTTQKAQGWFNTGNTWATCGTTSGNAVCVTAEAGVTANEWGGGYDINGGSLASKVGGYTSTLSTTTADVAATTGSPAPAAPAPTPIYFNNATVRITNVWATSNNSPSGEGAANAFDNDPNTKYLNFDKLNAGVTVKLNAGRVVNGFTITTANDFSGRDPTSYKLYGSNDGITWVLIQEGSLSLTNDRLTTSGMINITNSSAYVYYYIMFPTTKAGTGCGLDCDSMQIAEITYYYDANNTTTSTATGTSSTPIDPVQAAAGPTVEGGTITQTNSPTGTTITSGGSSTAGYTGTQQTRVNNWTGSTQSKNNVLYIEQTYGTNNQVTITQSGTKNRIDFTMGGNNNVVNNTQTGSNYLKEEIPGWGNNITINQSNTSLTNYAETKIQGNGNTVNHTQTGTGNHILFNTIAGDINTINSTQTGNAGHYAETKLTGNFNNVKVEQSGNIQNKANIDVTNAGGAATVDLQQTGGKNFTIIQSCVNPAGCSTTIRQ